MDLADVSSREAEVLAALGAHLSNAQIAGQLHISVRTVESHVSALMRKLDASDRQALAAIADRARTGHFVGLPASLTTFVGRSTDRAAILAALDDSRLVTVVGPDGVGKTRLVAMVADGAQSRFPAGGAFVAPDSLLDGIQLLERLGAHVPAPATSCDSAASTLRPQS